MLHTQLRKRIEFPADRPQYLSLPQGIRRLRISVLGDNAGTARFGFNEREVLLGGGYIVAAGVPFDVPDIFLDEGPIYFAADRETYGLYLSIDIWHIGPAATGEAYHRHTLFVDPNNAPTSTDLTGTWGYTPHARSWLGEEQLAYPDAATLGLIGNVTTTFADAASNTSLLRVGNLISKTGDIPSAATIRQIKIRLNGQPQRINDPNSMENTFNLSSLRLIKSATPEAYDYCTAATHFNPPWPLSQGLRWYEYFPSDQPLWDTTWTPAQINSGFGFLAAFQLIEETEESGCVYVALYDAQVDVYYTL